MLDIEGYPRYLNLSFKFMRIEEESHLSIYFSFLLSIFKKDIPSRSNPRVATIPDKLN